MHSLHPPRRQSVPQATSTATLQGLAVNEVWEATVDTILVGRIFDIYIPDTDNNTTDPQEQFENVGLDTNDLEKRIEENDSHYDSGRYCHPAEQFRNKTVLP